MRQGEILCDAADGYLQISGVDLIAGDPRWCAYNIAGILDDRASRGDNLPISGADRVIAFRHDDDEETRRLIPFAITGWVDTNGNAVPAHLATAERERAKAYLDTNIIGPPGSGTGGRRSAIYDCPDGNTYTADVQVLPLRVARTAKGLWIGHLEIIWPRPWEAT